MVLCAQIVCFIVGIHHLFRFPLFPSLGYYVALITISSCHHNFS